MTVLGGGAVSDERGTPVGRYLGRSGLQGYLAHQEPPPPPGHRHTSGSQGGGLRISEVTLHWEK